MLYKVTVGRDVYVGSPEEVVAFMAKADGAPAGGPQAYMEGIAARLRTHGRRAEVDVTDALAFLESLAAARLVRLERRKLPGDDRVDPQSVLGDGPIAFGEGVDEAALRRDLFGDDA